VKLGKSVSKMFRYGLDGLGLIHGKAKDFCLRCCIQIGSGSHSASSPMDIGGFYPWDEVAGA
jgi:hypothetical protein